MRGTRKQVMRQDRTLDRHVPIVEDITIVMGGVASE